MKNPTEDNNWWRVVERERATRQSALPDAAQSRLWSERAWRIEAPRRQIGYVKMWNARAVDLRWVFFNWSFAPQQLPDILPEGEANEDEENQSDGDELEQSDELARRLGLALQAPPSLMLSAQGPLSWPSELFAYQRDGVRALVESPRLLLADDMGLGKSIQAIAALRLLLHRREAERALFVVPASLLEQWRREIARWAPELSVMVIGGAAHERRWQWRYRAHIALVSYETLRADWVEGAPSGPGRVLWDVVLLDEAQRIKNAEADITRICKKLARRRSWALTGTPLENRSSDVASILEWVTGGRTRGALLRPALDRYQLRRRKADVLHDLPPKISTDLILPLSSEQRRAYDRALHDGRSELRDSALFSDKSGARLENVLALITHLKQICNFEPSGGASSKIDDLLPRLQEIADNGEKALIFTQYTDARSGARRIAQRLEHLSPLLYTGDMNTRQRDDIITRFNEEAKHPVLILSLKAGGQGLNLQCASYVFHFDRWWNPAALHQAEDRAHRLGQTRPVHVYRYVMQDTVEQRIEEVLQSKAALFDQIVDDASLDPARLSQQDWLDVVGL